MNTELDHEVLAFQRFVEIRDGALHFQCGSDGVRGVDKCGHDRIADRFDDIAVALPNNRRQKGEMRSYQVIGAGVPDSLVKRCRSLQIGEHQGHLRDADFVARAKYLIGKQIAECLQCGCAVRRQRFADPLSRLDNQGAPSAGLIRGGHRAGLIAIAGRYALITDNRARECSAVITDIGLVADLQRAQPVISWL